MGSHTLQQARYAAATAECGGRCPIEAAALGRLAQHIMRDIATATLSGNLTR
jgi:hypothetical protein